MKFKSLSSARCFVAAVLVSASCGVAARQAPLDRPVAPADAAITTDGGAEPIGTEWERWSNGRYRITPGDVLDIAFTFVPEFSQIVTVQPDGYITLRDIPDLRAQGRTVAQLEDELRMAYAEFVREPALSITLKEFEAPYFVATGEVQRPGKYELRGAVTVTQAIAVAGGFTRTASTGGVVLYRYFGDDGVEASKVNVSRMYARKDVSEDPMLRPGDTIVVPKNLLGKVAPLTPFLSLWWWLR